MDAPTKLIEDYATQPVPQSETYGGWRVGFVIGGIGVALPALLTGAEVGLALGYSQSALAFLASGLLVTVLAILTGWVGMRSRLSTYMILRFSFGGIGSRLVSLTFAFAQFGWFGVNAYFFGTAAQSVDAATLQLNLSPEAYIILGGILMTGATIFGYKALDRLALFIFPLMAAALMAMVAFTFDGMSLTALMSLPGSAELSFGQAITVLAGGIIVGVVLVPDLTRYARGPRDVVIAMIVALAVIEVLVHLAASGPALRFAETDPLTLMLAMGFGVFAFLFLIFASFTTNAVNLYGSGLSLASVFPKVPEYVFVILAGIVGTALALLDIAAGFIDFLIWQSVIFSSVLGVYVVDFFLIRRGDYSMAQLYAVAPFYGSAFAAWAGGAAVSVLTFTGQFTLTNMSNLDGVLVSAVVYYLLKRMFAQPGTRS